MGFIWWALPTMLRAAGVPLRTVTAVTAALVFPWILKFLWAPIINRCRNAWWTWQHWILLAQSLMVLTVNFSHWHSCKGASLTEPLRHRRQLLTAKALRCELTSHFCHR